MKQEIEKRYILKDIPHIDKKDIIETLDIEQYYYFEDNIWKRLRYIHSMDNYTESYYYLHTIKHYIDGKTFEEEEIIKIEKGTNILIDIKLGKYKAKYLNKKRLVVNTYKDEIFEGNEIKNLVWEIDQIDDSGLIIAEMEIPYENYDIDISLISDVLDKEITGIKEYSNFSLAKPMNF